MTSPRALSERQARLHLREYFGHGTFQPGQWAPIAALLQGRDTLVVMPTGSGKSLIYQFTALMTPGLTVVVSPLIALMKDQTDKLNEQGLDALAVHSHLTARETRAATEQLAQGGGEYLFVTPERFRDREFFAHLTTRHVELFVVDEAHCVSQWGHDFRPDYLTLAPIVERLGRPPILALTATATSEVRADIAQRLGMRDPFVLVTGFQRPNLRYEVRRTATPDDKLAQLDLLIAQLHATGEGGSGIVYCATVKEATRLHAELVARHGSAAGDVTAADAADQHPTRVALYHGQQKAADRTATQERWMAGEIDVLVSTNAFGMGVDKPDVRFVAHYHFPGSLEAYYQEAGRAGRDGKPAVCPILYRVEDRRIQSYFLGGRVPGAADAARVATALAGAGEHDADETAALADVAARADMSQRRARLLLLLLKEHDLAREHRGGRWSVVRDAHGQPLSAQVVSDRLAPALATASARKTRDRENLATMVRYCQEVRCRTRAILDYFGEEVDPPDWRCHHCDACDLLDEWEALARKVG